MKRHGPEDHSVEDLGMFAPARARSRDPATSHSAAASVTNANSARLRGLVLEFLTQKSMNDCELVKRLLAANPQYSPSGVRTRRAELVAAGKVRSSGLRQRLVSGREAIIWEISQVPG
jgi:hypothetical protein